MLRLLRAWLPALALFLAAPPAGSTLLSDWSLDQVAARADLIVIGVVESQRTVLADTLMTETVIRVEKTLAGSPADRIVLSQIGGRQGDRVVEVVGDASLAVGDRLLLFTRAHPDGRRYLVGMSLGAYLVEGEVATQRIDVPLITPDGQIAPAPGVRRLTLGRILEVITRSRR